ncbi:hypothetical protein EMIT0324P_310002 [Pseudomonas chlororaphis]
MNMKARFAIMHILQAFNTLNNFTEESKKNSRQGSTRYLEGRSSYYLLGTGHVKRHLCKVAPIMALLRRLKWLKTCVTSRIVHLAAHYAMLHGHHRLGRPFSPPACTSCRTQTAGQPQSG